MGGFVGAMVGGGGDEELLARVSPAGRGENVVDIVRKPLCVFVFVCVHVCACVCENNIHKFSLLTCVCLCVCVCVRAWAFLYVWP